MYPYFAPLSLLELVPLFIKSIMQTGHLSLLLVFSLNDGQFEDKKLLDIRCFGGIRWYLKEELFARHFI